MATPGQYEVIAEDPGGSRARASMLSNVWLVTCKTCGAYDVVGPGHPAVRPVGDGVHELHDRSALHERLGHKDEACKTAGPNSDGVLDFSMMGTPPAMAAAQEDVSS